jgi:hypothetical protein
MARYNAHMAAVVEVAEAEDAVDPAHEETVAAAAKRVMWDSSLDEALERCRRQDEMSDRWACAAEGVRQALALQRWCRLLRRPVVGCATASNPGRGISVKMVFWSIKFAYPTHCVAHPNATKTITLRNCAPSAKMQTCHVFESCFHRCGRQRLFAWLHSLTVWEWEDISL